MIMGADAQRQCTQSRSRATPLRLVAEGASLSHDRAASDAGASRVEGASEHVRESALIAV
jgi:hypothetical protein